MASEVVSTETFVGYLLQSGQRLHHIHPNLPSWFSARARWSLYATYRPLIHYRNADAGVRRLPSKWAAMCLKFASGENSAAGKSPPQALDSQSFGILELTSDCCVTCSCDSRAQ